MKDIIRTSEEKLSNSARALAIMCRNTDEYRQFRGSTFSETTDEVLQCTQHVTDRAVEAILSELATL
jgi:hypothetical protein